MKEGEAKLVSTYRVDLFTLAIGPVHHAIELMKGENTLFGLSKQSKYVGRLTADINFTQTQKVEIQLTDLQASIFEKQLSHSYQASFRVVTFNAVGDSTKSYMVRPLAQKQTSVDALSAGELRRVHGEKETLVTKLGWEFQNEEGKKDDPFGLIKDEAATQGHHLNEPDAFEHPQLENSFDGGRGGGLNGHDVGKTPPYIVVSIYYSFPDSLINIVLDANGSTKGLKHSAEDLGEQRVQGCTATTPDAAASFNVALLCCPLRLVVRKWAKIKRSQPINETYENQKSQRGYEQSEKSVRNVRRG